MTFTLAYYLPVFLALKGLLIRDKCYQVCSEQMGQCYPGKLQVSAPMLSILVWTHMKNVSKSALWKLEV